MNVQHVPNEWVNQTWPHVASYVESALAYSKGEYTAEQAKVMVTTGQWHLLTQPRWVQPASKAQREIQWPVFGPDTALKRNTGL